MEFLTVGTDAQERYTHDQWAKRNGIFGFKIVDAAKTDTMVQWFYEVMRQAPYITPSDQRLSLAYGYFVHLGLMSAEQAGGICGTEITAMTRDQVIAILTHVEQE